MAKRASNGLCGSLSPAMLGTVRGLKDLSTPSCACERAVW